MTAPPSRPVRRRLGAAVVLLAATLLLACGKGGYITSAPSAGTAAATTSTQPPPGGSAPRTGAGRLTEAQARAYAGAVNLRPADVPGFAATARSTERNSTGERQLERQLMRCVGVAHTAGAGPAPAEHRSREFKRVRSNLDESVSSAVSFQATAALARAELALLRSSRTRTCLEHYLSALLRAGGLGGSFRKVSVAQGTPPAPGTSGGFAWRITALVSVRSITVPFYLDILGFVYGSSQVRLLSSSLLVPFPASGQEQLFSELLARARAHPM